MPGAGLARGRSPRPAPLWLHQLPAWIRRSTRLELTNVFTSVEVLAAVGRLAPPAAHGVAEVATQLPQPLREVSMSMPSVDGKPAAMSAVRKPWVKVSSSVYWFQSTHLDCRIEVPFTEAVIGRNGSDVAL